MSRTWNITTVEGPAGVRDLLEQTLQSAQPHDFRVREAPSEAEGVIEAWLEFETAVGRGVGHLRLRDGRAWTLLTTLRELHAWLRYARVTSDARAVVEPLTATFAAGLDEVLASPIVLVGTAEEVVERLHERRERWGYSYFRSSSSSPGSSPRWWRRSPCRREVGSGPALAVRRSAG